MADTTVAAGRGVIHIAIAKAYFMVAGYVIQFILPRLLHSDVAWGHYQLVVRLVSVIDNVIITGTIQGVSKFTAQAEEMVDGVKLAALKVQALLGGGIAVIYVALAPWISRRQGVPTLTSLYQLSAGIMICYAFYAVFVGSLNGLKRFGRQAALDMTFATLRAILILGGVLAGWGVAGAISGFVGAAALILVISMVIVGLPRRSSPFSTSHLWRYLPPVLLYTLTLNLIMTIDLILLPRFVGQISGMTDGVGRFALVSSYAGYYGTAQLLAFIPYQAIIAVAFVVFPLVSKSTFENDLAQTQRYIRQTLRLSLIFSAGIAAVFMSNPAAVINVVFPTQFRIGGPALRVLSAGMICFSMFAIINTILNSAGKTMQALGSGIVTLGLTAGANVVFVPMSATPETSLATAAIASSAAMALGVLLSAVLLFRSFHAGFPAASVVRVVLAVAVVFVVGRFIPELSRLLTLGECVLLFLLYYVLLAVMREFGPQDLASFRRVLFRGK